MDQLREPFTNKMMYKSDIVIVAISINILSVLIMALTFQKILQLNEEMTDVFSNLSVSMTDFAIKL